MPRLSQAEIRNNAITFVHDWEDETNERAESQTFWNEFFEVFGVKRRSVAVFERAVQRSPGKFGKIDLFWKNVVLVEHKSAGENLDKAASQAFAYLEYIPADLRPQFVLISDFARFRLYDLDTGADYAFALQGLPDRIQQFNFISGYQKREFKEQDPVNIKASLSLEHFTTPCKKVAIGDIDLRRFSFGLSTACLPTTRRFSSRAAASFHF